MPSRAPHHALLCSVLAGLLASACATPPPPRGATQENLAARRLNAVQPVEVVVMPVENLTEATALPLNDLRDQFQRGLVQRRYSPLSLEFVDQHRTSEATYRPGALGEQAVLRVAITGWDTSRWRSHATIVIDADVHLLDATAPETSNALWGGHANRRIDLSRQRDTFLSERAMLQKAVELFVDEVLGTLPARNPEAAPTAG
jgi:hypothetical protein